jgi:hypothetical protein
MAIRLDQEFMMASMPNIAIGNVRLDQEFIAIATFQGIATASNVRVDQEFLMMLTPTNLQGERVQLLGGPFQDALGNALSFGFLIFQLQHDATIIGGLGQIVGAVSVKVPLDIGGYISGTVSGAPVYMWPNDLMLPTGTTYTIWAYTSTNLLAWDNPQVQSVTSNSGASTTFNVNTWTPGP